MTRQLTTAMTHNLRFTSTGGVWAEWLLSGQPYGLRSMKDKLGVRALHQALIRALPGESLLLGVCSGTDPAAIVTNMLATAGAGEHPAWLAECQATLDSLEHIGLGQRVFYLSVPLTPPSAMDRVGGPARASVDKVKRRLGLPPQLPSQDEIQRWLAQADRIASAIPSPFVPTPATPAQMVWLHEHMLRRGLWLDPDLPERSARAAAKSSAALSEAILDESGLTDAAGADHDQAGRRSRKVAAARMAVSRRRYLKVVDAGSPEIPPSYQVLSVITDVPEAGMAFPGCEILGRIDESGLDVDFALRMSVHSSTDVARANQRALRNLNDQYHQRDGEASHAGNHLDRLGRDLAEYVATLTSEKLEVEVRPTIIFCVSGPTPEVALDQQRALAGWLAGPEYKLSSPLGYQIDLWWGMHPGIPAGEKVREFAHITTSKGLAALTPIATTRVGDSRGSVFALNITNGPLIDDDTPNGLASVVFLDPEGASDRRVSGSLGVVGEKGAGKALAVDTPIPTPQGWTTMGALRTGDTVFDESGHPTKVLATSPVMHGHTCYEVVFSDGSSIIADADHLWTTVTARARSYPSKVNYRRRRGGEPEIPLRDATEALSGRGWYRHGEIVTTEEIRDSLYTKVVANHAVPVCTALQCQERDLPLEPYLLGVWLGDGHSSSARIYSADPQVMDLVKATGYQVVPHRTALAYAVALSTSGSPGVTERRVCAGCESGFEVTGSSRAFCSTSCRSRGRRTARVCIICGGDLPMKSAALRCQSCFHYDSVSGRLRQLGVFNDKHVPAIYLRASESQRRSLLAGLLDTDGTVSPGGSVEYTTTHRRLAETVHELAISLGYRATLRQRVARLEGRDCGTAWTISFTTCDPVFRLDRKRIAQEGRTARHNPARTRFRYVVEVRAVPSTPVRCIRVGSPSELFLAGRAMIPTHNTATLMSLAGDIVDRGGQLVILDRTSKGEWGTWAESVTDSVVVSCVDSSLSLDPLRIFPIEVGSRIMQTFLTPLLNETPTSAVGVLLSDVLHPEYLLAQRIRNAGELVAHLKSGCDIDGARDVARLLDVFARRDIGQVIFNGSLPAVDLDVSALVIHSAGLPLPTREEVSNAHLFRQLSLEKVASRALHALVAAIARLVCFRDTSRLAEFVISEVHALTISAEGEQILAEFLRDDRKHRAVALIDSQDPKGDLPSEALRGLIPNRLIMRHIDPTLAENCLDWVGLDPADEDLRDLITKDTSPLLGDGVPAHRRGEGLFRDARGSIARVKVLLPRYDPRREAIEAAGNAAARAGRDVSLT